MNLAEKIQKERKMRGLTQEDLAQRLNVSRQSVSKWESGQALPEVDKILLLSECFGVSTDYLLKDDIAANEAVIPPCPATPPEKKYRLRPLLAALIPLVAGCAGMLLLWAQSLLNPPYAFGEQLGAIRAFSFFLRYHEIEALFAASALLALLGAFLLFWRQMDARMKKTAARHAARQH